VSRPLPATAIPWQLRRQVTDPRRRSASVPASLALTQIVYLALLRVPHLRSISVSLSLSLSPVSSPSVGFSAVTAPCSTRPLSSLLLPGVSSSRRIIDRSPGIRQVAASRTYFSPSPHADRSIARPLDEPRWTNPDPVIADRANDP
jgi:hypothetical protein